MNPVDFSGSICFVLFIHTKWWLGFFFFFWFRETMKMDILTAVFSILNAHVPWYLAIFQISSCQEEINYMSKMSLRLCCRNYHMAFSLTVYDFFSQWNNLRTTQYNSNLLKKEWLPHAPWCYTTPGTGEHFNAQLPKHLPQRR